MDDGSIHRFLPAARFTLAALLCLLTLAAQAEDYTFTTNNGTITITGYLGPGGAVAIPSTITGLPVTTIGAWAFLYATKLTSVDIPNTVTDIGDHAFSSCTSLNSVKLPNSVTNISSSAFMQCIALTDFILPTNLHSIGATAFGGCTSLTNLAIPSSVSALGQALCYGCSNLVAITVDTNNSFYGSLDGMLFNKKRTTLLEWPQGKAQSCTIPNGVRTIGYLAFYTCASLTNVNFPNTVTNIASTAFAYCSGLSAITFPSNLSTIGNFAFQYCSGLTSVTIPASVTEIGDGVFSSCASLGTLTVDAANSMYSSLDGILFDKLKTMLIQYPAAKAGDYNIPGSVRALGQAAFNGCQFLTSVSIPEGVTIISDWAFDSCIQLHTVRFPAALTNFGYEAFAYCRALTNIMIPSAVTGIQDFAFNACYNLTAIYFAGDPPSFQQYSFSGDNNATAYYLPGRTGWASTFAGLPAVLWDPLVQTSNPAFGQHPAGFGLPITGTPDIPILLEASATSGDTWVPLQSCTLTNGSIYLTDPEWKNFPARFYRLRSP